MWEQIHYLSKRHTVTVVSFIYKQEEYAIADILKEHCDNAIMVLRKKMPPPPRWDRPRIVHEYDTPEMRAILRTLKGQNFDVVIIEHIYMAHYQEELSGFQVLVEHNIESNVLRRFAELQRTTSAAMIASDTPAAKWFFDTAEQWSLLAAYEDRIWSNFPLRVTMSNLDKQEMDQRCPQGRSIIVESGFNTRTNLKVEYSLAHSLPKILFMDTLDYYPNIDAVFYCLHNIMPYVWEAVPDAQFCIAGRRPPSEILELNRNPRIDVIADVESMDDVARQCCLSIVPIRFGGGTRLKIIHSMTMGLPVVSTTLGAEGLYVTDGQDILIRDDPHELADSVVQVIKDHDLRNFLINNGLRLAQERYDWNLLFKHFEREILASVADAQS